MGTTAVQPVPARKIEPPQISLLSSVDLMEDKSLEVSPQFMQDMATGTITPSSGQGVNARWQGSFSWRPEGCEGGGVSDPCAVDERTPPSQGSSITYEPFVVWTAERCSAFGFDAYDYEERAQRLLEACQSNLIEEELWAGSLATSAGWPNQFLADDASDVLSDSAVSLTVALAFLEQALAEDGCGSPGVIHANPLIVSQWISRDLVERVDNHLETLLGTIVVPGSGYDGSGPEGQAAVDGSVWAYATDMMIVRLGAMDVIPTGFEEAHDRATNTITFFAQRVAGIQWDSCRHFAVQIDSPVPDIGGPGS